MSVAAVARKELRDVVREKTLVVAFLVQLFIAGFSALLLTGLLALNDVGSTGAVPDVPVAYVGDGAVLDHLEAFDMQPMTTDEAWDAFDGGTVGAILFETSSDVQRLQLVVPDGELHTGLLVAAFQDALGAYEDDLREQRAHRLHSPPLPFPAPPSDASYLFVHASLVPLLVLTPVVLAGAIAGDSLGHERRTGTLAVLRSTPLGLRAVVLGKLLVPVGLVPLQVALWGALLAANGFTIHLPALLVLATVLAAIVGGTGLLVTTLVPDEAVSQAAYAVVVVVLGAAALAMPRDPLNLITLFAAGVPDAVAWWSLAALSLVAVVGVVATTRFVEHRLRTV